MIKTLTLVSVLLSGCTTFQLGTVHAQTARTADQQALDILTCKDQAVTAANAPEQQAKEFALGATLVGYPAAVASDRATQRTAFDACMNAKGYSVSH
jgi:hypothetical protein